MEPEMKEFIEKLDKLISKENGLKVSGIGILCEHTKKMLTKLDKIESYLYWMEKRDKERTESLKSN